MTRRRLMMIAGALLAIGGGVWLMTMRAGPRDRSTASQETAKRSATNEVQRRHVVRDASGVSPADALAGGAIRVVDGDGKPAAAAVFSTADPRWSRTSATFVGDTGPDGLISAKDRVAPPGAYIWALARRHVGRQVAGPEIFDPAGQTLTLGPGSTVRLHVVTKNGEPVVGASCDVRRGARRVTDVDGMALLPGCVPGSTVGVSAYVIGAPKQTTGFVTLPHDGSPADLEITIGSGYGPFVLLDVTGDLAPDAEVRLEVAGGEPKPGVVTLRFGAPPVLISLRDRFLDDVEITATAFGARSTSRRLDRTVLAGDSITPVELELVAGGGVPRRGRVLNADGSPAPDVEVGLAGEFPEWDVEATDEKGWFEIDLAWLGQEIRAVRSGDACSSAVSLSGDMDDLILRLGPGATLRGVVRDETSGRAVVKATVLVVLGTSDSALELESMTDASGVYRVSGLPPDVFVLPSVDHSPRAIPTRARTRLREAQRGATEQSLIREGLAHRIEGGETISHDLQAVVQLGGERTFRIALPEGAAMPKWIAIGESWEGGDGRSRSARWGWLASDGAAEFTRFLNVGVHRFHVSAPGLVADVAEIVVHGDGPQPDTEIRLRARRRVLARLVDAEGEPALHAGIRIRVAFHSARGGRSIGDALTDASGIADVTDAVPSAGDVSATGASVVFTLGGGGGFVAASPFGDDVNLRVDGAEWARRLRADDDTPLVVDVPVEIRWGEDR